MNNNAHKPKCSLDLIFHAQASRAHFGGHRVGVRAQRVAIMLYSVQISVWKLNQKRRTGLDVHAQAGRAHLGGHRVGVGAQCLRLRYKQQRHLYRRQPQRERACSMHTRTSLDCRSGAAGCAAEQHRCRTTVRCNSKMCTKWLRGAAQAQCCRGPQERARSRHMVTVRGPRAGAVAPETASRSRLFRWRAPA